ncbi:MAG: glycine cleavage system aminomethyltransferase GcvT [Rectinemataceae bacterium]|nr:glycine cleavage system aminomethyltransferase GcvT [Rectinemataceae bacterium]
MKSTLLHEWHIAHGAIMAPFAGYDMPIRYPAGSIEEHLVTRRSVGLFDIDHMGQFEISGLGADDFVSSIVSSRIVDMVPGEARYSLLLDEEGLVLDDLFVYSLPASWWIVVNAGNREADFAWFKDHAPEGISIVDHSEASYMIAVQGPRALELLNAISKPCTFSVIPGATMKRLPGQEYPVVSGITRFWWGNIEIDGVPVLFGRTGYTGEDGGELFYPAEHAIKIWEFLLAKGTELNIEIKAIGLGARDSLRFEAGMPLHGHEISSAINPVEAGFKWACDFSKDFVGKNALESIIAKGTSRKLVGIEVSGGVPREGYQVATPEGDIVGQVVAGMFCPTVKKYVANAFVRPEYAKAGTELVVMIRGQEKKAIVVKRPLYVPAYRRTEVK